MGLKTELQAMDPVKVEEIYTARRNKQPTASMYNFAGLTALADLVIADFKESLQADIGHNAGELTVMLSAGLEKAYDALAEVAEALDRQDQSPDMT
jgi:malonyl CoA-acyl carrier protein transacylase